MHEIVQIRKTFGAYYNLVEQQMETILRLFVHVVLDSYKLSREVNGAYDLISYGILHKLGHYRWNVHIKFATQGYCPLVQ